MDLASVLEGAIRSNDLDKIGAELSQRTDVDQDDLNDCFAQAMPQASLSTLRLLHQHGARLNQDSFRSAIKRGDPAVFQFLIEAGWDFNSTEFGESAIQ